MEGFKNASFEEIGRVIDESQRFVLLSHRRPDGDAIGSAMALALSLTEAGKEAIVVNEDEVPERLRFLPCVERVKRVSEIPEGYEPDVVFVLDSADLKQLGNKVMGWLGKERRVVNIDHHVSNPGFGEIRHVDATSPATGQIVYELIRALKMPLTGEAAVHLWAAISTDTGSFQYPSTTARTYEIGAELIREGVNVGEISQELYESFPFRRIELLRELLKTLKLTGEGRVASWILTQETIEKLALKPGDSEGLIDVIRAVEGVRVAVFFKELLGGAVKVSCRSKSPDADVSMMCGTFGGGGHRLAAGARIKGTVEEVEEKFLKTVYDGLDGKY